MKIDYLHRAGGSVHQGPSGTHYDFQADASGHRVADVTDPLDQERFLALTDAQGRPLFAALDTPARPDKPVKPVKPADAPAPAAD